MSTAAGKTARGFKAMALREENAYTGFEAVLAEILKGTRGEQHATPQVLRQVAVYYLREKLAKLDRVGGRLTVAHGIFLDTGVVLKALDTVLALGEPVTYEVRGCTCMRCRRRSQYMRTPREVLRASFFSECKKCRATTPHGDDGVVIEQVTNGVATLERAAPRRPWL